MGLNFFGRLCILFTCQAALVFTLASQASAEQASGDKSFMALADKYIDNCYFPFNPSLADEAGVHRFADKLDDDSRAGIQKKISELKKYETIISAVNPATLSEQVQGDRELILNNIHSQLLTLETIRPWQKNPDYYSSSLTNSAFVLMERKFAPANDRLRALIAREKQMPAMLKNARINLVNPPRIYTEIALEQLPGLISFFNKDVPLAFSDARDAVLIKEFKQSNAAVIKSLQDYQAWLQKDLLPKSHGEFKIGTKAFRAKLSYDEMVDIPLNKLIFIDMVNMRQNQKAFARIAREIDPAKTPRQILQDMSVNHPDADKVLDQFRTTFDGLITFIKEKKIITLPTDVRPELAETPPFMRATTFASMDTPGPFETQSTTAFFNVTLPEAGWSKHDTDEYMKAFSYPLISTTSIHETYPGHYIQFAWMHKVNDRVRKLFGANSNAEGWAHYTEQMMLDEGFGQKENDATAQRLLKLGQLQDALLRNARFIVGIKLHTGQMTFNQGVAFFEKEGYQTHSAALIETKRGTSDPTYLYYTLGKLQILKLRADMQAAQGNAFNLQTFHDDFMRQGFPPIKIVRKALLHNDSPTL